MTEETLKKLREIQNQAENVSYSGEYMNGLNPETRLCPKFDEKGIAQYQLASAEKMGFRVLDNCAQEHMQ
ncbi:MAG: hypothetical protein R3Y63_09995 [Eubacteriales bacterium]